MGLGIKIGGEGYYYYYMGVWVMLMARALLIHFHFFPHTHTPRKQLVQDISAENGGVIISFPRSGTNSDKVMLKGAKQCIDGARTRILEVVEDLVHYNSKQSCEVLRCKLPSALARGSYSRLYSRDMRTYVRTCRSCLRMSISHA